MNVLTEWLSERFPEHEPLAFYRELFPAGELEARGVYNEGEYHAVAIQIIGQDKAKRYSVTDDLDVVRDLIATDDFCVMSPVSYAGRARASAWRGFFTP